VEVVDDAWVFELVDLIEDDDRTRAVVLLEPVDEFVVGCRLPVDVDGGAEIVEDLVECSEAGIVPPAVHVGGLDVEDFFAKAFGDEFAIQVFPVPLGPVTMAVSAGSPFVIGSRTLERWLTSASRCSTSRGTNPARRTRASRIIWFYESDFRSGHKNVTGSFSERHYLTHLEHILAT
jgi:hypothetical protein